MEQKRPADIFQELLDYLWNGLGLEEKGWKRLKKGDFKKKSINGLTYQIWFDRSRYNYIDYEIGHGNVEVGFTCIIKQGDDWLYSFIIEPTTGGSFFRMLTEDLYPAGGLQLAHPCGRADGGTVRNSGAAGGVPPSDGIARNTGA